MNRLIIYLALFFSIIVINSCINFVDKKQVFPQINFNQVEKIRIDGNVQKSITNKKHIKSIGKIFNDSSNYYKNELLSKNKNGQEYSIKFFSKEDTLDLWVYPTDEKKKLEMGFLDSYKPNEPNNFRFYNRFYMNDELINFIIDLEGNVPD